MVADEVRKLAEKSGRSTGEIDTVTQSIISQSDIMLNAIEAGRQSIKASADIAAEVDALITNATQSVKKAGSGVDDIASSVADQKTASSEVAQNMVQIAQMSEHNHATIQEVSKEAQELRQLATSLTLAVGGFKAS